MSGETRHYELVDAVNDAKNSDERLLAEMALDAFRQARQEVGLDWSGIGADMHTMARFGDVDMCCGVLFVPPYLSIQPGAAP